MKTLLIASLFSFSALACPNLNGNYKICKTVEGMDIEYAEFSVMQRQDGKTHIFHISSINDMGDRQIDTYKADGKIYEQNVDDVTITTQASCSKNELTVISKVYDSNLTVKLSKVDSQLVQKISGFMFGKEFSSLVVCE